MTDLERIELALRRVSSRLKSQVPWDMCVTDALDEVADELVGEKSGLRSVEYEPRFTVACDKKSAFSTTSKA